MKFLNQLITITVLFLHISLAFVISYYIPWHNFLKTELLILSPVLVHNSLCSPGQPQIYSNPLVFAPKVLRAEFYASMSYCSCLLAINSMPIESWYPSGR